MLLKDDPAVYIADSGSMSSPGQIAKRAGFSAPQAVKDGHVYVIEDNLLARPGPRLIEGSSSSPRRSTRGVRLAVACGISDAVTQSTESGAASTSDGDATATEGR